MSHLSNLEVSPSPSDTKKTVTLIREYSAAVDPANQTGAGFFGMDVTVAGVLAADHCVGVIPPAALEANLQAVGAVVKAADTIRLTLQALAAVDGASRTWTFLIVR